MLAHGLAIAIWAGSLALYGAAFFFPEVHRRHDFLLSGVGGFYGLVLWFTAAQTSPTELSGHVASIVLLSWLGWQTLTLRRKRTPSDRQTPLTKDSWPALGRQVWQSVLDLVRATPLSRWLPKPTETMKLGEPAIAVAEIRASSLKDVDYEFVDELSPVVRPAAVAPGAERSPAKANTPLSPSLPQRPGRLPTPQTTAAPSDSPAATVKPARVSLWARVAVLKTWLGDVAKAKKAPKTQQKMIEISPRPSPLDRKKTEREVIDIPPRPSPLDRKKPKREMIEIPPRPSPLNRKKPKPTEEETSPPETVIIVDTAAVESNGKSSAIAPEASVEPTQTTPTSAPAHGTDSPTEPPESNWDDGDSNWLDD